MTETAGFIRVVNFDRYQNADIFKKSNGRPPWIKLWRDMILDDELMALPYEAQLLFDRLLLAAAATRNAISSENKALIKLTAMDESTISQHLPSLLEGGWLTRSKTGRASRVLSRKHSRQDSPPNRRDLTAAVLKGSSSLSTESRYEEKEESEPAAAEPGDEPPRDSRIREVVSALNTQDAGTLKQIEPLATQLPANVFEEIVTRVHERKRIRNDAGLLRTLLVEEVNQRQRDWQLAQAAVSHDGQLTTIQIIKRDHPDLYERAISGTKTPEDEKLIAQIQASRDTEEAA